MYINLDPVIHSQFRLGIISVLFSAEKADFVFLKKELNMTAGNLSSQLTKLSNAGFIKICKSEKNNYPLTTIQITKGGKKAFEMYIEAMKKYLKI